MDTEVLNKAEDLAKEIAGQVTTLDELNGMMRSMMKAALEKMLNAELTVHLDEASNAGTVPCQWALKRGSSPHLVTLILATASTKD